MNAAEQAKDLTITSKIATIVNLFKIEFPDIRVDLKPWSNDPETRSLVDPDSIDLGFHFPGRSRSCACRSMLVQIRLYIDPLDQTRRAIGTEINGFDHRGKQWQFSTIADWTIVGETQPIATVADKLKQICCQIQELLNNT